MKLGLIHIDTILKINSKFSLIFTYIMKNVEVLSKWRIPLVGILTLFALIILSFPILNMGYFWDDWNFFFVMQNGNVERIADYFYNERPLAWVRQLEVFLFNPNPVVHQLKLLSLKVVFSLMGMKLIGSIVPNMGIMDKTSIVLIFFFFPGFSQDSSALTYAAIFSLYIFYLGSILLSLRVDKSPRPYEGMNLLYTLLAMFLLALGALHMEYLLGLEVIRITFTIGARFAQGRHWSVSILLKGLAPYLLTSFVVLFYIAFIFEVERDAAKIDDNYFSDLFSFSGLFTLFFDVFSDFYEALFGVWFEMFRGVRLQYGFSNNIFINEKLGTPYFASLIKVVLFVAVFSGLFLAFPKSKAVGVNICEKSRIRLWLIAFVSCLSLTFVWVGRRNIEFGHLFDRYSLIASLSSVLALLLVLWNFGNRRITYSLIISLLVLNYYNNRLSYWRDWKMQQAFYEQLSILNPNVLGSDNLFLVEGYEFKYRRDKAITSGLSVFLGTDMITYDSKRRAYNMPYWVDFDPYWKGSKLDYFSKTSEVERNGFFFNLEENTNVIALSLSEESCLKINWSTQKSFDLPTFSPESYKGNSLIDDVFHDPLINSTDWCHYYLLALKQLIAKDYSGVLNCVDGVSLKNYHNIKELVPFYLAAHYEGDKAITETIHSLVVACEKPGEFLKELQNFIEIGGMPSISSPVHHAGY